MLHTELPVLTKDDASNKIKQNPTPINSAAYEVDDAHKRWSNQSAYKVCVWAYFNDIVAKDIVSKALQEKMTLATLYQKLALARAKCEWIKQHKLKNNFDGDFSELMKNVILEFPDGFGNFQYGGSGEGNVLIDHDKGWGEVIVKLSNERFDRKANNFTGLSYYQYIKTDWGLVHPCGAVLQKLENDFQLLCATTNFFDYLVKAAWLTFILSNFPPISRGSSAVNTWIIDKIAQLQFNFNFSIRPYFHDWIAFYETADQYINFYVISAAASYVKSLNIIPEMEAFSKKMVNIMEKNPVEEVIKERQFLWEELKVIIKRNLHKLDNIQSQILNQIVEGNLEFKIESNQLMNIAKQMIVSPNVEEIILKNPVLKWGYIDPECVHQFSKLLEIIITSDTLEPQIVLALKNGMQLTELNKYFLKYSLTVSHLQVLTSRAAVLLYNTNTPIKNLFRESLEETEKNILCLVAKKYCNGDLHDIANLEIRNSLLLYVDPCFLNKIKMSELIGGSAEDTNRKIFSAYMKYQYLIDDPHFLNSLNYVSLTTGLNTIINVDKNNIRNSKIRNLFKNPVPDDQKLLFPACESGDLSIVERCLSQRIDFNIDEKSMRTPLYVACEKGHDAIVEVLLQRTNAYIDYHMLAIACKNRHEKIVERLLDTGAWVDKVDLFSIACEAGLEKIVERLLSEKVLDFKKNDVDATKIFKQAISSGNVKVVALLLKQPDIKINHKMTNERDVTPLYLTCNRNYPKIAKLLLEQEGVDINELAPRPFDRVTPLYNACKWRQLALVEVILQSQKADVNYIHTSCDKRKTALHAACFGSWDDISNKIVSLLLDQNADIKSKNAYGETTLDIVINDKKHAIIFALLLHAKTKNMSLDSIMSLESLEKVSQWIDSPKTLKIQNKSKYAHTIFFDSSAAVLQGLKDYLNINHAPVVKLIFS